MRATLAIILAVLTAPASALTPLPPCAWDASAQRLGPTGTSPGNYAFVQEAGDGFASSVIDGYEAYEYGPSALILQHCPSGQELLVVLPQRDTRAFAEVYDDMVFGSEPYRRGFGPDGRRRPHDRKRVRQLRLRLALWGGVVMPGPMQKGDRS